MINIKEIEAIFQFYHNSRQWYSISIETWKTRDPNFWGVGNLKFVHMININKMAAIFQFFHNGRWWYSIFIDTQKTRDPNFRGSVIWNFYIWSILTKWQLFFKFFIMADSDIPFPLTLGKPETQTLGVSNLKFFHTININEMVAIFQFFHISWLVMFHFCRHSENQRPKLLGGVVIWNFFISSILMKSAILSF